MHFVGNKWIFKVKYNVDGLIQKYNAKLVAKGFHQTPNFDYFETFSPMIKSSTIRVILMLTTSYGWDIQQIDINNVFLNDDILEVVFMTQPKGFVDSTIPTHVYSLHKELYGLK